MRKVFVSLLALASAGAQQFPKGQVVEKVVCQADATKDYALYLPSNYNPSRRWPVVFCLDPGARGRIPVERFKEGAEKFGFVIVGSNNSRNGPWAPTIEAFKAMYLDANARFALDGQRVYMAGFSGGARASIGLASAGGAAGVVGCGAAWGEVKAAAKPPHAFFGTAGYDDFNYPELQRTDRELAEYGVRHRIAYFTGGHEWAPPALLAEALEWFELEAMRAKERPKDDALINAALAARVARAGALPVFEQEAEYRSIATDFAGFVPVDEFTKKAGEIANQKGFRDWQKQEAEQQSRQRDLTQKIIDLGEREETGDLRKTVAQWEAKAKAAEDSIERRVARRSLTEAAGYGVETGRDLIDNAQYKRAAILFEMSVLIRPERNWAHYSAARARGFLGDRKKAYANLKNAVERGFKNPDQTMKDMAFSKFVNDPEFQAIVASMKN
jgi:predicted esterase